MAIEYSCKDVYNFSENGNLPELIIALKHGDNTTNWYIDPVHGYTAIYIAAIKGHIEIFKKLLDVGIDVHRLDNLGYTTIHAAIYGSSLEMVQLLVKREVDYEKCGKGSISPLLAACRLGNLEIVQYLIEVVKANVETCNDQSMSLFDAACHGGHMAVIRYLKDVVKINTKERSSAINYASSSGHLSVVRYLVEELHSDISVSPSPLYSASLTGKLEVVRYLVEAGADIECETTGGETPLHVACKNGNLEVVRYLIGVGANIEKCNNDGVSPFYFACGGGHFEVVRYLKEVAGADISKTVLGRTGYDAAKLLGHQRIVDYLRMSHLCSLSCAQAVITCPLCCPLYWGISCFVRSDKELERPEVANNCLFYYCIDLILPMRQAFLSCKKATCGDCYCCCRQVGSSDMGCCFLCSPLLLPLFYTRTCCHAVSNYQLLSKPVYDVDVVLGLRLCICCCGRSKSCAGIYHIDDKDQDGNTAIHGAARSGDSFSASVILLFAPDLNLKNKNGETCLHLAIRSENYEMAKKLMNLGADLFETSSDGRCPLDLVDKREVVEELVKFFEEESRVNLPSSCCLMASLPATVTPSSKSKNPLPLFYVCLLNRHEELLSRIRERNLGDINKKNEWGYRYFTPLGVSCRMQHLDIIKSLLDTDLVDDFDDCLSIACEFDLVSIAILMINKGASVGESSLKSCKSISTEYSILVHPIYPLEVLTRSSNAFWFYLIQSETLVGSHRRVAYYVNLYPQLALAHDLQGRTAIEMATEKNREYIRMAVLIHGKFKLVSRRPEHASATCLLFKALDESVTNNPTTVALKFMKIKSSFEKEISCRESGFSDQYVINSIGSYPMISALSSRDDVCTDTSAIGEEVSLTKDEAEKLFLLVMPFADRNLYVAMKQERWAGRNIDRVAATCRQVAEAVKHIHSKGFIHGDLKPLNLVRVDADWKLIDFDASARIGIDEMGGKFSSAYCPPEALLYVHNVAFIRSATNFSKFKVTTAQPLIADESYDIWSLGCIFYQLCCPTLSPLFHADQDDNLPESSSSGDDLLSLAKWDNSYKANKMLAIPNLLARNLLDLMLTKGL